MTLIHDIPENTGIANGIRRARQLTDNRLFSAAVEDGSIFEVHPQELVSLLVAGKQIHEENCQLSIVLHCCWLLKRLVAEEPFLHCYQ